MDNEKLIELLSRYSEPVIAYKLDADFAAACMEAANELAKIPSLQVENEKLRVRNIKLEDTVRSQRNGLQELRANLARMAAERDAAIEDLSGQCEYCQKKDDCVSRKGSHWNCWEWRGIQKED